MRKEDTELVQEFQQYLGTIVESLKSALSCESGLSATEQKIEKLKSQFFLTDVCFKKTIDLLKITENLTPQLGQILTDLRDKICTNFEKVRA